MVYETAVVLIGLFFVFVGSRSTANFSTALGALSLMAGIIIWFNSYISSSGTAARGNRKRQVDYSNALRKYSEDKTAYDCSVREYSKKLIDYESNKKSHEFLVAEFVGSDEYKMQRRELRYKMLKETLKNATIPSLFEKSYRRGVMEDLFYQYLMRMLAGNKINISKNSVINDKKVKRPYLPDFVLSVEKLNQHVVIEIDEPYIGKSGIPIHYTNCSDKYIDNYFIAHGWLVIRFAEEQIIKQPELCVCFIIETLCNFTPSPEISMARFSAKIKLTLGKSKNFDWDTNRLVKIRQWDREQGHKMAFARYRNTYLPSELIAKIKEEDYVPVAPEDGEPQTPFNEEDLAKRDEERRRFLTENDDNDLPF